MSKRVTEGVSEQVLCVCVVSLCAMCVYMFLIGACQLSGTATMDALRLWAIMWVVLWGRGGVCGVIQDQFCMRNMILQLVYAEFWEI